MSASLRAWWAGSRVATSALGARGCSKSAGVSVGVPQLKAKPPALLARLQSLKVLKGRCSLALVGRGFCLFRFVPRPRVLDFSHPLRAFGHIPQPFNPAPQSLGSRHCGTVGKTALIRKSGAAFLPPGSSFRGGRSFVLPSVHRPAPLPLVLRLAVQLLG